jgi:hypothetical protein
MPLSDYASIHAWIGKVREKILIGDPAHDLRP